jgi:SAM-dependent methyltransferase
MNGMAQTAQPGGALDAAVGQVISDYERLEPGGADSWNPLGSKYQLGYRLAQFYALTMAIRASGVDPDSLRVLDLGCGNGRSTRMYLDLGLRPAQVVGNDLRPNAIAQARALNPAIRFELHDGGSLGAGFNWISAATVFSSVSDLAARKQIAARIWHALPPGGFLFYFDMRRANAFAGGDALTPLAGVLRTGGRGDNLMPSLKEFAADFLRPDNEVLLLRKPWDGR